MFLSRGPRLAYSHAWRRSLSRPAVVLAKRFQYSDAVTAVPVTSEQKPYYITTPIFYVNGAPHIGHFYTLVLADVAKRWQQLKGNKALLCTGTDEYGLKVQQAAERAGSDPKPFVDVGAKAFQRVLRESGHISLRNHSGWYSVSDEAFYSQSGVEDVVHWATGQMVKVSKETGNTVEWMSERNYHFNLSSMAPKLLEFYEANPNWLIPTERYDMIKAEVAKGLEDLSISRPSTRLTWGIPVPGDPSQTIYVWLDALINYITFTGYPWTPGVPTSWPADLQVIGKDIIRFHCIYWPAFLLAIGAQPPRQILSHAHWTMSKKKMSKSVGNVIDPFHAMERWGVDVMRYYMCLGGGILNDADYSNGELENNAYSGLAKGLGSLLTRVGSAKYNLEDSIRNESAGVKPDLDSTMEKLYGHLRYSVLEGLTERIAKDMEKGDFSAALQELRAVVKDTHSYIHHVAPWQADRVDIRAYMLYPAMEALRLTGILLQPFMPTKMDRFLSCLGVDERNRGWESAVFGADFTYGVGVSGNIKEMIFPPLPVAK
ncbi:hypothetical protein ABW20_dc0106175 [Dactylellina cionopaga]|nr:hypothetical protein ABW20_dc0106175 [Dactylellina cionopaga]